MNVFYATNKEEFEEFTGAPTIIRDSSIYVSCSSHSSAWRALYLKGHVILRGHLAR